MSNFQNYRHSIQFSTITAINTICSQRERYNDAHWCLYVCSARFSSELYR